MPANPPAVIDPRLCQRKRIKIQRGNGQVQQASVSQIDHAKQCVVVEWTENGKTKGKSMKFAAVCKLNPELSLQIHPDGQRRPSGERKVATGDELSLEGTAKDGRTSAAGGSVPGSNEGQEEAPDGFVTPELRPEDKEEFLAQAHLTWAPIAPWRR